MRNFFVYRDESYLSGWINSWVTEQIVAYLINHNFLEVDATEIRDQIIKMIEREEAFNSTIVFAQDLIPDTIIERPTSDSLVRRYLNSGGRIIWIGDVPFFWQGLPNKEKQWWGRQAQNSVLDIAVQQIIGLEPIQVNIKPEGEKRGLKTSWAGNRPIMDPANTLTTILATSTLENRRLIHAWFKNFNELLPTSGFIRIWDYIPHHLSSRLLDELYNISTYGLTSTQPS